MLFLSKKKKGLDSVYSTDFFTQVLLKERNSSYHWIVFDSIYTLLVQVNFYADPALRNDMVKILEYLIGVS
jgi:hypothetical protein